jgi:DNA repair exonuclease SbcCD ATPase subunit
MKSLLDKVSKTYDSLILISHNQEVHDMCEHHISVVKENNISKVVLK